MPFNLIITHSPGYEYRREVFRTLKYLLEDFEVLDIRENIILGRCPNPLKCVDSLRRSLPEATPILRVIPVLRVTSTYIDAVKEEVDDLLSLEGEGSFAIRIDGYLLDSKGQRLHRRDAAIILAEGIERPVNLSNPDILVYVKVVRFKGRHVAGIYVGPPDNILSTAKITGPPDSTQ